MPNLENINPDILLGGGILFTLFILLFFYGFVAILNGPRKATQARLTKYQARFGKNNETTNHSYQNIKTNQKGTPFDQYLKEVLPNPAELKMRLDQTGKQISLSQYIIGNGLIAITVSLALILGIGLPPLPGILMGLTFGIILPHKVIGSMAKSRINAFSVLFPDAIDLIVRGLKSGLPVSESLSSVSTELPDPVGGEFKKIIDSMRLGQTLEETLWDAAKRIDLPDFKFFVISLSVQKETGGNLAETLSNLGEILRKRHQMKLKIKAMSSEGKASAMIVGALPFIMFGLIVSINYEYASILFTDPRAIVIGIGGLIWMVFGFFIMAKMINFEI